MPVSVLLCEGAENSPDIRVLNKLLGGLCSVEANGGKYGMGARILARRQAMNRNTVFGILDGDFLKDWHSPAGAPRDWHADQTRLGWRWERKEIENYILDPEVVSRVIDESELPSGRYRDMLGQAASTISTYQAARTALSKCRRRFQDLPSAFGATRGLDDLPYPKELDEASCRAQIEKCATDHQRQQEISPAKVLSEFDSLLPEFQENGSRRRDYLYTFAGKDLLWAMNTELQSLGLRGAKAFREKILIGIEQCIDDISTWIPEWSALQTKIRNT